MLLPQDVQSPIAADREEPLGQVAVDRAAILAAERRNVSCTTSRADSASPRSRDGVEHKGPSKAATASRTQAPCSRFGSSLPSPCSEGDVFPFVLTTALPPFPELRKGKPGWQLNWARLESPE